MLIPQRIITLGQFFPFVFNSLIDRPDIQHCIEDIVAGNDPALYRNLLFQRKIAGFCKPFKEPGAVERAEPLQLQRFRDDIQRCAFPAAISTVQDGQRFKETLNNSSNIPNSVS